MDINKAIQSALEYHRRGKLKEAENIYVDILQKQPDEADALNLYGSLLYQKGDLESAIKLIKRALELDPNFAVAYVNLGNALAGKKQFDIAINHYRKALELDPNLAVAYVNLGNALAGKKQLDIAINYYRKALELDPNFAEAFCNLGRVLNEIGQVEESIRCIQRALELNPNYAEAYTNLGLILSERGENSEALDAFNKAISVRPNYISPYWARCMSQLPRIYMEQESIQTARKNYHDELIKLQAVITLDTPKNIEEAAKAVGVLQPFYLAHQGMNVKELQQIYGDLVCKIMAAKCPEFTNKPIMPSILHGKPMRVGLVSGYFCNHSVWKIPLKGWIENIDKSRFSLYGYYTGTKKDGATAVAMKHFHRFIEDIYDFETLCRIIRKDNLHILIFSDIGQDPMTLKLASLWLAPIQCVSAMGHPVTSGLKTIDYALSSDLMEPINADDHYTEQLIRLPNLSFYQTPSKDISYSHLNRETFGLRQSAMIYLCSHQLPTYLPQYDDIYPRIAEQIGDCQFVFISSRYSYFITEQFHSRLRRVFARFKLNHEDYTVFLPRLDNQQYRAINCLADIFLDSIDWSANNSAFEAIACNLPMITLPGEFMRGRHSMGILKMMGLNKTIVSTVDEYVELAIRLGKDNQMRCQISEEIASNKHSIYYDRSCITALENFIEGIVRERFEKDSKEIN